MQADEDGQQELIPGLARAREVAAKAKGPVPDPPDTAEQQPVARVLVDVPLAHLDRPFDYLVPRKFDEQVVPGARVKVRFAGQVVDGFVIERAEESAHPGRLQPLQRAVSAEPVLRPEIAALVAEVAARYAGTRSDVLRLAVPNRHAGTEKQASPPCPAQPPAPAPEAWAAYEAGPACLARLAEGASPKAVLTVLPGDDWTVMLAEAVAATAASGRGALVCVPDRRDLDRLDAALTRRIGEGTHVSLTADVGPAKRYAAFLAVARGACRIVIGTRAAAFAPVHDLGLVAIWDDGDDLYDEPRAPYPHTREVLLMRAGLQDCAALVAGHARSVEAQYLVRTGWAQAIQASRETVRERVSVTITGADAALARDAAARTARLPSELHAAIRDALQRGPVLVQTPRAGYATRLACDRCREPALCRTCHGPLRIHARGEAPACAWCGQVANGWQCPECGGFGLRAPVLGDRRTAEELGRAFPGVPVQTSSGERVLARVADRPALVVSTPGAEPVADAGYAAVCLLDTWLPLARDDLRAAEEALRRWTNAGALVGPAGGRVVAVGEASIPALQALVRWDPAGYAERELAERVEAHLPPASMVVTLVAAADDLEAAVRALALPPVAEVLGPVPTSDDELQRTVVRVPRRERQQLSAALRRMQGERATRKLPHVQVKVDPHDLG